MTLRDFLNIVEIRTKLVSLSGLLIGSLAGPLLGGHFSWLAAGLMWPAALAIDMGTTAFNSFFGWWDGSDDRRFNRESDKVLVHAGVAPGLALLIGLALYGLAGVLGLALCSLVGWWLLPVGLLCLTVGFAYNGGPWPLSHTPLGELFAGGFLGLLLPLLTMLVVGAPDAKLPAMLLLALPSGLMVASILTVNNSCDIEGDRQAGRLTLSILIGRPAARWLIPVLGLGAWLLAAANCFWGNLNPWSLPVILGGAMICLPRYYQLDHRNYNHHTKGASMAGISQIFLIYSLSLILSLGISLLFGMD